MERTLELHESSELMEKMDAYELFMYEEDRDFFEKIVRKMYPLKLNGRFTKWMEDDGTMIWFYLGVKLVNNNNHHKVTTEDRIRADGLFEGAKTAIHATKMYYLTGK